MTHGVATTVLSTLHSTLFDLLAYISYWRNVSLIRIQTCHSELPFLFYFLLGNVFTGFEKLDIRHSFNGEWELHYALDRLIILPQNSLASLGLIICVNNNDVTNNYVKQMIRPGDTKLFCGIIKVCRARTVAPIPH